MKFYKLCLVCGAVFGCNDEDGISRECVECEKYDCEMNSNLVAENNCPFCFIKKRLRGGMCYVKTI